MKLLEVKGKTVEEAIQNGLREMELERNQVDVTVFDEGSKGFLGFGVRPARVLLTEKPKRLQELQEKMEAQSALHPQTPKAPEAPAPRPAPQPEPPVSAAPPKAPAPEAPRPSADKPAAAVKKPAPAAPEAPKTDKPAGENPVPPKAEEPAANRSENRRPRRERPAPHVEGPKRPDRSDGPASGSENSDNAPKPRRERKPRPAPAPKPAPTGEPSPLSDSAKAYLNEIIAKMDLQAACEGFENPDGVFLNLTGEDVGTLIGYRGETLDALQYLVSLHINRGEEAYHRVLLDAENYRGKREETLNRLAHHLANKAVKSGRKVSLEPMNPYERRILHSALQDDNRVRTHSEGDEPYRRVVITPRRPASGGASRSNPPAQNRQNAAADAPAAAPAESAPAPESSAPVEDGAVSTQ